MAWSPDQGYPAQNRQRPRSGSAFKVALKRAEKILVQQPGDRVKLYAMHAPMVECIGKGKARTRYEFGVKASVATTNEQTKGALSPCKP